jgi:hypothetical protein
MNPAALGLRVHSGWTALVALAIEKKQPVILARQRPHLVATFSYAYRQPYHTAEKMALAEASVFLQNQRAESLRLALSALRAAQAEVAQQGYKLTRSALLLASGRPLPELPQILASHALIHTADGEFFRKALLHACSRANLSVTKIKERELLATASAALGHKSETLARLMADLGKPLGSPWSQDEKFSALAAWLALTSVGSLFLFIATCSAFYCL